MKFTHISDCHIGSWRDEKISQLGINAFKTAIDESIAKKADFVLVSGDLFNSALPPIDKLKDAVIVLKKLKQADIPCYIVPGNHDFSPSGKTMLDVLEHAGLLVNVFKGRVENNVLTLEFTVDKKTNAKITGIVGKKGSLDKKYYEKLDNLPLEKEKGFKIFLFHTALTELKPKNLEKDESISIYNLPRGFDYYAGGHVHIIENKNFPEYKNVVYAGALFPNNFREIEELSNGGYYFYDDGKITWNPVVVKEVLSLYFDCNHKIPSQIEKEILQKIKETTVKDKIVTMRVEGELISGKPSDIKFNEIFGILIHKGAYFVMKSTSLVKSKEFETINAKPTTVEEAEEKVIKENLGKSKIKNEEELIRNFMKILSSEKQDGETKYNFEKRLIDEVNEFLKLD